MRDNHRTPGSPADWMIVAIAAVITFVPPAGYFTINYSALASAAHIEAEIQAAALSQIVISNPGIWKFQEHRLRELLERHASHHQAGSARILDLDGAEVASVGRAPGFLRLKRSSGLFDSGALVGQIEQEYPLHGLFLETAGVALLGALLGIFVFALLRRAEKARKRAEDEIRELNRNLERRVAERTLQFEEASRAKSEFLANMSHELRTPLNSIIGFTEMLKDGVLGELEAKQRGFIADVFDAGTHLLSLINDILDLSKVEAGAMRIEATAVDVAGLLKTSLQVVREKVLSRRIRLETRLDSSLGTLLADERKMKQIVYNLLFNAVKFTPDGGAVTLSARRCGRAEVALDEALPGRLIPLPPGEDGEFLKISVEDSGIGIAEEYLPKLFEPFTQIDESLARRHAGTGLGLSLVRRLAELHGGTVGVASRPGSGSRFHVWLPYRTAAAHGAATAPSVPGSPLALVIENDDRTAALIEAQLRAEGFAVNRAATAEEGLERAAKSRPQLITLEIFLPTMDGWEFMRRLNSDPRLADTPVVIITISEDFERGLALGARRVLHKPFAREELIAALAELRWR